MASEESELIICGYSKATKIWNLNNWTMESSLRLHTRDVTSMLLLSKTHFVSGSLDGIVHIINISTGKAEQTYRVHHDGVTSMAYIPDNRIVTGSRDRTVKVINFESEKVELDFSGHSKNVSCVANLYNNRIASGSWDKTIRVWDIEKNECIGLLEGHELAVVSLIYFPTDVDEKLVSGSNDKTIKVWDIQTGECLHTLEGHTGYVTDLCRLGFRRLVSCSKDTTIRVWDIISNECTREIKGHKNHVNCLAKLDNDRFVSGSLDMSTKVWSSGSGRLISTKSHDAPVTSLLLVKTDDEVQSTEEKEYRIDFVENECPNFAFRFENGGGGFRFLKSLLVNSALDFPENEWTLPEEGSSHYQHIDPNYVLQLCLGERSSPDEGEFLELYCLFRELKMYDYMYCLIRMFEARSRSLTKVLKLCERCFRELEGDPVIDKPTLPEFKYAFTQSIMNLIKKNYQKIFSKESLHNKLIKMKISKQVMAYTIRPITKHPDFGKYSPKASVRRIRNFKQLFNRWTEKLFKSRAETNCVIFPQQTEEESVRFDVHKEIIVLKSNFFFQFFTKNKQGLSEDDEIEGEGESDKEEREEEEEEEEEEYEEDGVRVIRISSLRAEEIHAILEYIYTSKVTTEDMEILLNVLQHSHSFNEREMRLYLFGRIKQITKVFREEKEFTQRIVQFGYRFQQMDESIKIALFDYWSQAFGIMLEELENLCVESERNYDTRSLLKDSEAEKEEAVKHAMEQRNLAEIRQGELEEERKNRESLNSSFQIERETLEDQTEKLEAELDEAKRLCSEKEESIKTLQEELDEVKNELSETKSELLEKEETISHREKTISENEGKIEHLDSQIVSLNDEIDEEKTNHLKTIEEWTLKNEEVKSENESKLEKKEEEIINEKKEREEERVEFEATISSKSEEIENLQKELKTTEKLLEESKEANSKLNEKYKEQTSQCEKLSEENENIKQDLEDSNKEHSEEMKKTEHTNQNLVDKNKVLETEKEELIEKLKNKETEFEDAAKELETFKTDFEKIEKERNELDDKTNHLESLIEKKNEQISDTKKQVQELNNDLSVAKSQSRQQQNDFRKQVKALEKDFSSSKNKIQQVVAENKRSKKEITTLKTTIEKNQKKISQMKEQLDKVRREYESKLVEERTKTVLMRDDFDSQKEELEIHQQEVLEEKESEIKELTDKLRGEKKELQKKYKKSTKVVELAKKSISNYKKLVIFLICVFILNLAINVFYIVHNFGGDE